MSVARVSGDPLEGVVQRFQPASWPQFVRQPFLFLARWIFSRRKTIPRSSADPVAIVCLSDTHNRQPRVPKGDILIHSGDLTSSGTREELQAALDWLNFQPHQHKIVIAGNHDLYLERKGLGDLNWGNIIYLQDDSCAITCENERRLNIYGSPWSPRYGNWAFQYPRFENIWRDRVPPDTDILITHSPPQGHLDHDGLGCVHLLEELWRVRPRLHVFGHMHSSRGIQPLSFDSLQDAYERAIKDGGGISGLARVVIAFVRSLFVPARECRSILVNAAILGGRKDELTREPIVVEI